MSKVRIEERDGKIAIVSDCHDRPCATVIDEGIKIQSRHSSDKCENILTWEQLEEAKKRVTSSPLSDSSR
jgi:hypothetical protein